MAEGARKKKTIRASALLKFLDRFQPRTDDGRDRRSLRNLSRRAIVKITRPIRTYCETVLFEEEQECPLFRLPREIRDLIYSYLVVDIRFPHVVAWCTGGRNFPVFKYDKPVAQLPQMLLLNHKLAAEYKQCVSKVDTLHVTAMSEQIYKLDSSCCTSLAVDDESRWPKLPRSCRQVKTCVIDYYGWCLKCQKMKYDPPDGPGCSMPPTFDTLGTILRTHFLPQMPLLETVKLRIWIMTWCDAQPHWIPFGDHVKPDKLHSLEQLTTIPNVVELEVITYHGREDLKQYTVGNMWHYTVAAWYPEEGWREAVLGPFWMNRDGGYSVTHY